MTDDADLFAQQRHQRLPDRKHYRFEEKMLRRLVNILSESPSRVLSEARDVATEPELLFKDLHACYDLPIKLTAYKVRRLDFIRAIREPDKTAVWKYWTEHTENYGDPEYAGVFYEARGDRMPPLLLHNCTSLPLIPPFWRCTKAMEGYEMCVEPAEGAIQAFRAMNWTLE